MRTGKIKQLPKETLIKHSIQESSGIRKKRTTDIKRRHEIQKKEYSSKKERERRKEKRMRERTRES